MPGPNSESTPTVESGRVAEESLSRLTMMASQLEDGGLPLNEDHVTELISQRRAVAEYIHEDRKRESWDGKYYFTIGALVWVMVFGISLKYFPEHSVTLLAATATFLGGYGFGIKKR